MKQDNIGKICSGCGACVAICPKHCLRLSENIDGFLRVDVDFSDCLDCGLCVRVCPFLDKISSKSPILSGYFYCESEELRQSSSSGGVCGLLYENALSRGMNCVGVEYNSSTHRAVHAPAYEETQVKRFRGSKYLQSNPSGIYDAIVAGPCCVVGTPCQIAGVRKFAQTKGIDERNVYVDFYCHGVPSALLWEKYLMENNLQGELTDLTFRDKTYGWEDRTISLMCDSVEYKSSLRRDSDLFQKFYLSNLCLNECCYESCPFRRCHSAADLRVGDAWGHDVAKDDKGVSVVAVFTKKGEAAMRNIEEYGHFFPEDESVAASGQIVKGPSAPKKREAFISELRKPSSTLAKMSRTYLLPIRIQKSVMIRLKRVASILRKRP